MRMLRTVYAALVFLVLCGSWVSAQIASVIVSPAGAGTLSSAPGDPALTLAPIPASGYIFTGWSVNAPKVTDPATRALLAQTGSPTLIANFAAQDADAAGQLSVSSGVLSSSGVPGGPFSQSSVSYTLTNSGVSPLDWGAAATGGWLALSAQGGSLAPGASAKLVLSLNAGARSLEVGYYAETVSFSNLTNSIGNTSRPATLVVGNRSGEISFVTTGESFAPVIAVDSGARVLWSWADGTTSSSASPVKNFGTPQLRVSTLSVTPWSALKRINLGYDASDGGDPAIEQVPPQPVVAVSGLEAVAPYLQKWCSSYAPIGSLNLDNFVNLDTVECFNAALTQVSLRNTPKLTRACFEQCALASLDLSESPGLADLRGAANPYTGINFGSVGSKAWHICIRDNRLAGNLPLAQFTQLKELLIWNSNQTGVLKTASANLSLVNAPRNGYTSADFSGGFITRNSYLDVSDNKLSSLNLSGCVGLIHADARNNDLSSDAVDAVLATLDSLGGYTGYLYLTGNYPPGPAGLAHAENLRQRKWTVDLATRAPASLGKLTAPTRSIVFSTENDWVDMEVRLGRDAQVTWHWSDGSTDDGLTPTHSFTDVGHRTHYLTVDPPTALTYFGAKFAAWDEGISEVAGLDGYPNLNFLYLYRAGLAALDLAGCSSLNELHLAMNPVPASVSDKWFKDLDSAGNTGGTFFFPPEAATPASAAARERLVQKGWNLVPWGQ